MKPFLHKSFSTLLALLVLFSTVSFTIEKHFCGDILVDVALFTEAEKCEMEVLEIKQNKTCCKDVTNVVEGQDELKFSSFEDLEFEQQQFLASYVYSYINLFEGLPNLIIPHKDYSPPNLVTDIQVLHDTFLI
ncbi:HYC_CC_PP family protein [Gelatiniphilus marinus]|uniref:HYC_CC_PP family protein n=1 Tax=Gelatiniphilus marinus TaxID=1759464 RepID=UPI003A92B596